MALFNLQEKPSFMSLWTNPITKILGHDYCIYTLCQTLTKVLWFSKLITSLTQEVNPLMSNSIHEINFYSQLADKNKTTALWATYLF